MNREELLKARGWVQHGAGLDLWQPPASPDGPWLDGDQAGAVRAINDRRHATNYGSVTYRPTAEQAQTSPLLAACAARGMCEREVIGMLFVEGADLRKVALKYAAMQPPAPIHITADEGVRVMAAILKRTEDIAAAWKALARAERHARAVSGTSNVDALNDASHAVTAAAFRLRALGIDPDAADEPGQVPT